MASGAWARLVEQVIEQGDAYSRAKPLDPLTLVRFGGQVPTAEEYGAQLVAAGFAEVAVLPSDLPYTVAEAARPKRPVADRWNARSGSTGGLRTRLGTHQSDLRIPQRVRVARTATMVSGAAIGERSSGGWSGLSVRRPGLPPPDRMGVLRRTASSGSLRCPGTCRGTRPR